MRAYQHTLSCPLSLSNTYICKHDTHMQACVPWIYTHKQSEETRRNKNKRTILCAMFVPVAGNLRVFIRLMDMKRKREGQWTSKEGGKEGDWAGGYWIIPQQILYNGPTSHTAACNFLAPMIERGILQLHRLALIMQNLPHKTAPVDKEWAVAFWYKGSLLLLCWMDSLGSLVYGHTQGWQSLINGLTLFKRLRESRDSSYRTGQGSWSMVKMYALLQCSFTSSSTSVILYFLLHTLWFLSLRLLLFLKSYSTLHSAIESEKICYDSLWLKVQQKVKKKKENPPCT